MSKKLVEMTAAGGGTPTIGPIQPMGSSPDAPKDAELDKKRWYMNEMFRRNKDLKPAHFVIFKQNASYFMQEDFDLAERADNFDEMANLIREEVSRQVVRKRMNEVVRKKEGKFVLYAPNDGEKHKPKIVAVFSTKLAAKRAELARFPPRDPEKLARLKKQIEKLMKNPGIEAKDMLKEMVDRDTFARFALGIYLKRDIRESLFREEQEPGEYDKFVKSLSQKAIKGDKGYMRREKNYDAQASVAMLKKLRDLQNELGVKIKPGESKKHTDGKMYLPFSIRTFDGTEIKPVYLYVDGAKVKAEFSAQAKAAMTQSQLKDKIISALSQLGEGSEDDDPNLVQAQGQRNSYLNKITKFIDNFLAKLSPVAMTILKNLWAKKYRKLGAQNERILREGLQFQVTPEEAQELMTRGVKVNGDNVSLTPSQATFLMRTMANDPRPNRNKEVINSIVQKVKEESAPQVSRNSDFTSPAAPVRKSSEDLPDVPAHMEIDVHSSNVPGAQKAKHAEVQPGSMPGLMTRNEFNNMYGPGGYLMQQNTASPQGDVTLPHAGDFDYKNSLFSAERSKLPSSSPSVAPSAASPSPADDALARRRRVAAQDAKMMGGNTKPVGSVKVK